MRTAGLGQFRGEQLESANPLRADVKVKLMRALELLIHSRQ